jgi:hypothetical protein
MVPSMARPEAAAIRQATNLTWAHDGGTANEWATAGRDDTIVKGDLPDDRAEPAEEVRLNRGTTIEEMGPDGTAVEDDPGELGAHIATASPTRSNAWRPRDRQRRSDAAAELEKKLVPGLSRWSNFGCAGLPMHKVTESRGVEGVFCGDKLVCVRLERIKAVDGMAFATLGVDGGNLTILSSLKCHS